MSRKTLVILGVVLLAVLAVGGWYFLAGPGNAAPTTTSSDGKGYEITAQDHTLGNKNAKVVLIEYAAPVCPHCAHFNEAFFPDIKKKYIDTGKVFYVFRVFPIRQGDGPAQKLALCLPADKYLPFIDLLFRNQPKWDADEYQGADLHGGLLLMAKMAGMSADQADQCMASTKEEERINKVASEGEARYSISATPTFIVNGVPQSQLPLEDLGKVLDQALAAAH
jgi:protein-disulfide isomerase